MISNRFTIIRSFILRNLELLFWCAAIVFLFFMESNTQATLCVFKNIGIDSCPGCGIGHAIHEALHLNFIASFNAHPLGVFAVLIIFFRIKQLLWPVKPKHCYGK